MQQLHLAIGIFGLAITLASISPKVYALPSANIILAQNNALDFINSGMEKANKGDFSGAIANFTEAVRINPNYSDAYYNRGLARAANQDLQGAIEDYTLAI